MSVCPYCQTPVPPEFHPDKHNTVYGCATCLNPFAVCRTEDALVARVLARHKDLRITAPEGSIGGELLAAAPAAIQHLPVLPEVGHRILAMVNTPDASMQTVASVIQQDPVIALKVLKLANSVVYGGLQEVKDINTACARLGLKTIANAVQAAATSNLFSVKEPSLRDMMQSLWRSSIAVAHCACKLADMLAAPNSALLFMAGLIQDIGSVALLDIFSTTNSTLLLETFGNPKLFEQILHNFSPLMGLHIMQHWKMPAEFRATTYCRNAPDLAPGEDLLFMTHVVSFAALIGEAEGYGLNIGDTDNTSSKPLLATAPSARYLNMTDIKIATLRVDLQDELEGLLSAIS